MHFSLIAISRSHSVSFANKQDLPGALSKDVIREVSLLLKRDSHLYFNETALLLEESVNMLVFWMLSRF